MNNSVPAPVSTLVSRPIPKGRPVNEWADLSPGQVVEVWEAGVRVQDGCVDAITDDGRILWLVEPGMGSRRLFLSTDVTLYLA